MTRLPVSSISGMLAAPIVQSERLARRPRARLLQTTIGVVVVLSITLNTPWAGQAQAGQPEACLASEPSAPVSPNPCVYKATVKGGVDAFGDWIVVIKRPTGRGRRPRTITIDSKRLPASCVTTGPRTICPIGTIKPGDTVTSRARVTNSFVGTGNPCPVPNPGAPPPIAGGEC